MTRHFSVEISPGLMLATFVVAGLLTWFALIPANRMIIYRHPWTMIIYLVFIALIFLQRTSDSIAISHDFLSETEGRQSVEGIVKVEDVIAGKGKSDRLHCRIRYYYNGTVFQPTDDGIFIYVSKPALKTQEISPGFTIWFSADVQEIPGPVFPLSFNWKNYAGLQGVHFQAWIKDPDNILTLTKPTRNWKKWVYDLRNRSTGILDQFLENKNASALLSAMLIGERSGLEDDFRDQFAQTGVMHILAVSGLHVGIFYMILNLLMTPLMRRRKHKPVGAIFIVLCIWAYALVTGFSASVCRAAFMFTLFAVGKGLNRQVNIYNVLAVSAFVMLFLNPLQLFKPGFQLSYIAVAGIASIFPVLSNILTPTNRVITWIWELCCVTVSAQLATFPLGLFYFNQFPTYFLPANMVAVPLATFFVIGGILILLTSPIPILASIVGSSLNYLIELLTVILEFLIRLPNATYQFAPDLVQTCLVYSCVILIVLAVHLVKKILFVGAVIGLLFYLGVYEVREYEKSLEQNVYCLRYKGVFGLLYHRADQAIAVVNKKMDTVGLRAQFSGYIIRNNIKRFEIFDYTFSEKQPGCKGFHAITIDQVRFGVISPVEEREKCEFESSLMNFDYLIIESDKVRKLPSTEITAKQLILPQCDGWRRDRLVRMTGRFETTGHWLEYHDLLEITNPSAR